MNRSDWTGLIVSICVHIAVVLLLAALSTPDPDLTNVGYVEVEFGAFSEGRPVTRAPETPVREQDPEPDPEPEQEAAAPPEESKPVELPDQTEEITDPETVNEPEAETIAPEEPEEEEEPEPEPEPQPEQREVQPLGSGSLTTDEGETAGDDGPGTEPERSAPFQIEGLNRVPVSTTLPSYDEQVNALIRIRITVDPRGRIIQRVPLIKGNPRLEQSVMAALQDWQFNPLPANAPQENQTGVITFRFRLQ